MGSATAGIANTTTASTRNKNFPRRRAAENWTAFERRFPCTSHSKDSREGARWCALWAKENSGRQCCTTAWFAGPVEAGVLPRTAVGDRLPYSWWYRLLSPEIGNPLATGLESFLRRCCITGSHVHGCCLPNLDRGTIEDPGRLA